MAKANFEFIRRENIVNLTRQLLAAPPGERRLMLLILLDEERARSYPLTAPPSARAP